MLAAVASTSEALEQLHQGGYRPSLGEHQRDQPHQQCVAAAQDLRGETAALLFDLQRQIRAYLFDLFPQAQFGLTRMALGGELRQMWVAFFQPLEGLGNHACPCALVRRGGQRLVEFDDGVHGGYTFRCF